MINFFIDSIVNKDREDYFIYMRSQDEEFYGTFIEEFEPIFSFWPDVIANYQHEKELEKIEYYWFDVLRTDCPEFLK